MLPFVLLFHGLLRATMISEDSDQQAGPSGYHRKRKQSVEQWKSVEGKVKRNCGESYVSVKTKQHVTAGVIGPKW